MQINILDAKTLGDDMDLAVFEQFGKTVVYPSTMEDELISHTEGADVLVLNKVKINENTLPDTGKIKLICIAATGFDNVDTDYCQKKGIAVCNVKGYSTNSVAQVSVAMALSLYCHISEYTRYAQEGDYTKSGVANSLIPVYHELCGKKWGIVGCGAIGDKVAEVATALGCEVAVYKRTPHKKYPTEDIDSLLKTSDIISVHIPLSGETENLIDRDRIFSMKKSAILINTARGAVVDEAALCDAIEQGAISGIGIDVYSKEPFGADHPYNRIMHRDNVCLTPHMAWGAFESRARCIDEMAKNIASFINNENRNRLV